MSARRIEDGYMRAGCDRVALRGRDEPMVSIVSTMHTVYSDYVQ
jgi:hypothetical protein